jgi:hypothetical protein
MPRISRKIGLIGLVALAMLRPALTAEPPKFQIDPSWPKTLPNNWILGQIGGIFVDAQDHIWVSTPPRYKASACRGSAISVASDARRDDSEGASGKGLAYRKSLLELRESVPAGDPKMNRTVKR